MCAERLGQFVTLALVLATLDPAQGTDATNPPEGPQDRGSQQKGRLSLQNTAEIQHCLVNAGDVGCGVFECFENNSCEIRGLHGICMTFLHNAGKFDAQGKSFIKDALRCKAHALRHRFGCISRKCPAIKEMVFQLQRECYLKHDLCSAAQENIGVIVEMIHFKDLLLHEPYVDLVNLLLSCGEEVKEAVTRSVLAQCEQNWGGLCSILSFCTSNIQRPPLHPGAPPLEDRTQPSRPQHRDSGHHLTEASSREAGRGAKGERGSKVTQTPMPGAEQVARVLRDLLEAASGKMNNPSILTSGGEMKACHEIFPPGGPFSYLWTFQNIYIKEGGRHAQDFVGIVDFVQVYDG